jgi:elongation factor 1-beta
MSIAAVKIKIMPSSPETDLEDLRQSINSILSKEGVQNAQFEEEPIAFGLKAIIVMFGWPDEKSLDPLEEKLKNTENVNSVQIVDIRRAIG